MYGKPKASIDRRRKRRTSFTNPDAIRTSAIPGTSGGKRKGKRLARDKRTFLTGNVTKDQARAFLTEFPDATADVTRDGTIRTLRGNGS